MQFEHAIIDAGLKSKQVLFWNKGMILGHSDYHWAAEPCFYGCHEGENCEWFGDRCQTTVWDIKRDNTREYVHPTQKPTALAIKAIFNSSKAGETVLDLMNQAELREKFCELFGFEPGQTNIANLRRRLACRIQEIYYGGLSEADRQLLEQIADGDPQANLRYGKNGVSHVCGTRYQRVWKGKKYEVTALGNGTFEYDGTVYQSLSAIAREITGTRWNGKLFFGVK